MLNTPHRLSPAELARLRGIASRVRAGILADDAAPFVAVDYDECDTRTIIPWREAMELDG